MLIYIQYIQIRQKKDTPSLYCLFLKSLVDPKQAPYSRLCSLSPVVYNLSRIWAS
jgi:hypothetical protein